MKKPTGKILYSIIGIIIIFAIILIVNIISSIMYSRVDMTEDKLYTLSTSSKRILAKLDTPVTIRYYFSKNNNRVPVFLKTYATRIEDLLNEYEQAGKGNVIVEKFDPEPDSDAEDSALLDGIKGQMLNTGDKIYFGISISCLDKSVSLPFLSMERENLVEYDITNAISQVLLTEKPVIGVMSAFPVLGEKPSPMMMQAGQFKSKEAWVVLGELKKNFEVREIPLDTDKIDSNIKLLIAIHPSGISEKTEFAIDQFILNGGKMIAFLDPMSYYAQAHAKENREYMSKTNSTLDKLLKTWGVEFDVNKAVGDMIFARRIKTPQKSLSFVGVLDITKKGFNKDDVISSQLNKVAMVFSGGFTGTPATGLEKGVLIKTTEDSGMLSSRAVNNPEQSFRDFSADSKTYDLAIRLSGKFKTAFPDGPPKSDEKNKKDDSKKDFLKESRTDSMVVLVADADILVDDICVRVGSIMGQRLVMPQNDNLNFFQNLVDYMSGDNDMIGIRCRQRISRPFEKIKELQAEAEKKFKDRVVSLEKDLKDTERRLNQLQQGKSKDQRFIMSPEQQKELKTFREKQSGVRKDLKKYRKQLRKDIVSLQNNYKLFNIALMPILVILFGIFLAIYRRKRSSAK